MKILKFTIPFVIIFFIIELGLRSSKLFQVYSEKNDLGYISYYGEKNETGLHTWTPNSTIDYQQAEFNIQFETNSLGLREREFEKTKKEGVFRIIMLGDSFTEGDGTTRENAIPAVLEDILNDNSDTSIQYEVMNAGVSGSDIIYMNRFLETTLLDYQPDAVIYFLNTTDIYDIMIRGGKERFQIDGSALYKKAPWIEPFYKYSHLFRAILRLFGVEENLLNREKHFQVRKQSVEIFNKAISDIINSLSQSKIKMHFIIHPVPIMMKHTPNYQIVDSILQVPDEIKFYKNPNTIDLNVLKNETAINIFPQSFDVLKNMNYEDYAWPINAHFNSNGYRIMAEIMYSEILKEDSLFFSFELDYLD